jgi:hypothetical protein
LFNLGQTVMTPGVAELVTSGLVNPAQLLARHVTGDCGDLNADDKQVNEEALEAGLRIFSSYKLPVGKVWVITEADRSSTCLLLPSEY